MAPPHLCADVDSWGSARRPVPEGRGTGNAQADLAGWAHVMRRLWAQRGAGKPPAILEPIRVRALSTFGRAACEDWVSGNMFSSMRSDLTCIEFYLMQIKSFRVQIVNTIRARRISEHPDRSRNFLEWKNCITLHPMLRTGVG